jgi:hypothetical protein
LIDFDDVHFLVRCLQSLSHRKTAPEDADEP